MGLALGYGLGLRNQLAFTGKTIPSKSDALVWLDGTISGNNFVDKISGRLFPISNKDFNSDWTKGFPYKSAATFSAPAGDAVLIAADVDGFFYTSGVPNQIPVTSLFQDVDYEHRLFSRHISQSIDIDTYVETYEPRVAEIVLYNTIKTGAELTACNSYFSVPSEITANVKWVDPVNGVDTNAGTKASPYKTMLKAEASVSSFTIYVKTGLAVEEHYYPKANTWISTGLTTLRATVNQYAVWTSGTTVLSFNNFIIDGTDRQVCFRLFGTSTNKTLNRCCLVNSTTYSINNESTVNNSTLTLNNCVIKSTATNYARLFGGCVINGGCVNYEKTEGNGLILVGTATGSLNIKYCKQFGTARYFNFINLASNKFDVDLFNNSINGNISGAVFNIGGQKTLTAKYNFTYSGVAGIIVSPTSSSIVISNNRITNTSLTGYEISVGTEMSSANDDVCSNILIENNMAIGKIAIDSSDTTINSIATHGIFVGHQKNAVIRHNYIEGNRIGIVKKHTGIADTSGGIFYNICKNDIEAIYVKGQKNVKIYCNTCVNSLMTSANQGFKALRIGANLTTNYADGADSRNNIFCNYLSNKTGAALVCIDESNSNMTTSNNNVLFAVDKVGRISITDYNTLNEWNLVGYDINSINYDPLLANLIPENNSPSIGAGADLGISFNSGLDASTNWGSETKLPAVITKTQPVVWDCGAYIH